MVALPLNHKHVRQLVPHTVENLGHVPARRRVLAQVGISPRLFFNEHHPTSLGFQR